MGKNLTTKDIKKVDRSLTTTELQQELFENEFLKRLKYTMPLFDALVYILFGLATIIPILSILLSGYYLYNHFNNLITDIKSIGGFINYFQPCITGFALSQMIFVSAFTLSDLGLIWSNSCKSELEYFEEEGKRTINKNKKIEIFLDFVLSSIFLEYVILLNNTVKLGIELPEVARISIFLAVSTIFCILFRYYFIPRFINNMQRGAIGSKSENNLSL
jgi:hypothetical protein